MKKNHCNPNSVEKEKQKNKVYINKLPEKDVVKINSNEEQKYIELNKRIEKLEEKFSEHIEHSNDITNRLFSQISLINDNLKKIISNNTEIKNLKASEEINESTENLSEQVNNKEKKHNINQKDNIYSNSPKSNKKKRGPYKKHNKDDLENSLKYLEIKDSNGNYWKYSLSIFHRNTGTASYRCYDTSCSARGTINIKSNEDNLRKFECPFVARPTPVCNSSHSRLLLVPLRFTLCQIFVYISLKNSYKS